MSEKVAKNSSKSLLMLITSMLIFGTIGIFRRFIPLSSALIAFFRGIIGAACMALFVKLSGRKLFHGTDRKKYLVLMLSGAFIGLNWVLLFEAYNYTSVSIATLCYYMQPTIVILASTVLFREKMTAKKAACTLAALIGMILISGVGSPSGGRNLTGIILGLGAALLYSCVVLLNMKTTGVDAYEKTVIQLSCAGLVLVPYLAFTENLNEITWNARLVVLLLIVSIIHTGICYALYFGSINGLKAQTIALFSYLDPITALILSALILHERLTVFGLLGAILILGSAIYGEVSSE